MNRKTIVTVLILITLAAVFAVLPYFAGLKAEKYFHETMTAYSDNPSFKFKVTDYKRSWFNSYAETEMELTLMDEKVPVTFEHEIQHGPSLTNIALAKITTRLRFSEKIENELNYYFKDGPPIEIITHVGMLGGQKIEYAIPSFDGHPKGKDDININWQKLDGKIEISSDMSEYTGKMRAPLFAIKGKNGETARIENIVMDMDMKRWAKDLWLGSAGFNIADVSFALNNKETGSESVGISIKGISLDQTSSEENGFLLQSMIGKADSLTFMDKTFEKCVFDSELRNVSIDALLNLQHRINAIAEKQLPQDEAGKQLIKAMTNILPELLSQSPEYVINRLAFTSDKGDINGNASVKYVGNGDYKAFNPFNDIASRAMLSMPKEFLKEIMLSFTRKQIVNYLKSSGTEMAEEEIALKCRQTVDNNIKGMLQNNFFVADGDNYTTRFALTDTGMTINGKPLKIPMKK